jgi:hypothetical protein
MTVFQSYYRSFLSKYVILYSVLYFCVGKVTRGEEKNTGVNKEKKLFAVMFNLFPQLQRDTYLSTVLEQVSVQV